MAGDITIAEDRLPCANGSFASIGNLRRFKWRRGDDGSAEGGTGEEDNDLPERQRRAGVFYWLNHPERRPRSAS